MNDGPVLPPHPKDPVGQDPYPIGHISHRIWEDATREALTDSFRLNQRMLEKLLIPEHNFRDWFTELALGKFQIWAKRNLAVVLTDEAARDYEQWLGSYLQSWVKLAEEKYPEDFGRGQARWELELHLARALNFLCSNWTASAATRA